MNAMEGLTFNKFYGRFLTKKPQRKGPNHNSQNKEASFSWSPFTITSSMKDWLDR